jgi:enoyl-CoA hydratase
MIKKDIFLYEVDKENKIATITFNKPDNLNAFSIEETSTLVPLIREADRDDNVKVLILKGAGRAFSVGDNLSNFLNEAGFTSKEGAPKYERPSQRARLWVDNLSFGPSGWLQTLTYCSKATIAQVHGYCYGGSMGLAVTCDLTIAADDTIFGHPGYRYVGPSAEGLHLPFILSIGLKRMMELMLTGRPFGAEEAAQIGLINKAVPLADLDAEVQRYAKTIAMMPLDGIVIGKYVTRLMMDRLGYGGVMGTIAHVLGSNLKFDTNDFNMLKELRDKGVKDAVKAREARYAELGMDIGTLKAKIRKQK